VGRVGVAIALSRPHHLLTVKELRMRIHPGLPCNRGLLLLAFTLAGFARAAGAQPLTPLVGQPVPYRIGVPEGWRPSWEGSVLSMDDPDQETIIMVTAMDLAAAQTRPASMSEPEARRILTARAMSSDSVLLGLLQRNAVRSSRQPLSDVAREIGTLGAEKAGWLSAHTVIAGQPGWMRVSLTVVDGVLYTLLFMAMGEISPEQESLIARIGDSFVAADMSAEPGSRR
jgi:hypothetical protein